MRKKEAEAKTLAIGRHLTVMLGEPGFGIPHTKVLGEGDTLSWDVELKVTIYRRPEIVTTIARASVLNLNGVARVWVEVDENFFKEWVLMQMDKPITPAKEKP